MANEKMIKEMQEEAYDKGLNDAWELVRKLYDMKCDELGKIFGIWDSFYEIIRNCTPQEALADLKAYEEAQKIEVGDVVERKSDKTKYLVVTEENDSSVFNFGVIDLQTMCVDRITGSKKCYTKTGKHIDIQQLLDSIGE